MKSQWTRPAWCAAARPRPAWRNIDTTSGHGRDALIHRRRLSPRTNSMAMKTRSSAIPTS
ncbi:MAG: hypothetical protein R3B09_30140 [Nannocystaceae bacterium]